MPLACFCPASAGRPMQAKQSKATHAMRHKEGA